MTAAERQARRRARAKAPPAFVFVRLDHIRLDPVRTGEWVGRRIENSGIAYAFAKAVIRAAQGV